MLANFLVSSGLAPDRSVARRWILQGAVQVDGRQVRDLFAAAVPGATVQVGETRLAQVPPAKLPVRSTVNRRSDGMVHIIIWNEDQTLHSYSARGMTEQEVLAKERELLEEYADGY